LRREIRVRNFYTRIESDTHGPCELLAPGSESDRVLARHYRRSSAESKPRAHFFERRLITRSLCWLSARSSSRPRSLSATTAALRAARPLPPPPPPPKPPPALPPPPLPPRLRRLFQILLHPFLPPELVREDRSEGPTPPDSLRPCWPCFELYEYSCPFFRLSR